MTWSPRLSSPCSPEDLDKIFSDALAVLEDIGIDCAHGEAARRLADSFGTSYKNGRLHFPSQRVADYVEVERARQTAAEGPHDGQFHLGGPWACLNYCDPETQEVRPATSAEATSMIRLLDARDQSGVVPVIPGDVPPELATLAAERLGLINSRALGGKLTVIDPEEARFLIDMNLAAGRRYFLMEQIGISPLKFNADGIETAMRFLENPAVLVRLAGYIPMAGATCPIDPHAAAVQALAERLALSMLATTLGADNPGLRIRIEPFDFRHSLIVFGSPEWCLYSSVALSVNAYLMGTPDRMGRFRSVAKQPDEQAASERMASVLFQALNGVRDFGGTGQLSVDEVFSPQQAVIDREILAYAARVIRGLDVEATGTNPVAHIREGVEADGFAGLEDTAARFREFYWFPDLFRYWNVGRWRAEGCPSILAEAWAHAQEEIAQSTFQLEPDREQAVEAIYARAVDYIRTRA